MDKKKRHYHVESQSFFFAVVAGSVGRNKAGNGGGAVADMWHHNFHQPGLKRLNAALSLPAHKLPQPPPFFVSQQRLCLFFLLTFPPPSSSESIQITTYGYERRRRRPYATASEQR